MAYWRMQLHPSEPTGAIRHTVESLAAGYIGLDFEVDVPDLLTVEPIALPANHRNYSAFAREMAIGDFVLLFAHHFPFALVRVKGPYNYIRERAPEIGVWFRHFREIEDVRYYGDYVLDARQWQRIEMLQAIAPLREPNSASYQLIDRWLQAIPSVCEAA